MVLTAVMGVVEPMDVKVPRMIICSRLVRFKRSVPASVKWILIVLVAAAENVSPPDARSTGLV
jgi:hypothetical protein